MIATPEEEFYGINWKFLQWLIPLAIGLGISLQICFLNMFINYAIAGVWTVGNIGREEGRPWAAIVVAYITYLSRYFFFDESIWLTGTVFCSALTFESYSKDWRRKPPKKHGISR